ncbi:MAG: S9 family peptidase [Chloroflexi bacterium]|nr:S9 family peptidase [Chloroflexota bacterium]
MKVTAGMVARVRALAEPHWSPDGRWLAYLESFDGRGDVMLARADGRGPVRRLTADPGAQPTASYGGGVLNWLDAETVIYVAPPAGQLYAQAVSGGPARQLTSLTGRVAAPAAAPGGRWIACMVSGKHDQHIVVVDASGEEWPRRVSRAGDFVFDPTISADGSVAWQEWSVPDMAWDASRVWLCRPGRQPEVVDGSAPGSGEPVSAIQPRLSPDGRLLAYLSDRGGWWNLWLYDLATGERRQLVEDAAEQGGPTWGPGGQRYAWSPDGRQIAVIRSEAGFSGVHLVDIAAGEMRACGPQDGSVQAVAWSPAGDRLAAVWGRADAPTCLATLSVADGSLTAVAEGAAAGFEVAATPLPEAVTWTSSDGETVHGLFYAPPGHDPAAGPPPVIVRVHGGPTGIVEAGFDARTAYWLDRGWAILQVNYRGSAGYGRAYRQALHENWGVHDVEDTVSGAQELAQRGRVDGRRMVVMGGSAGGYTVLLSMALHPEVFAAGVDLYGVADLFSLSEDTHRFEAHYLDSIVGLLPATYDRYTERSPQTHADKITRPLLILQGDKDDVVPLAQSQTIYDTLQRKGRTVEMKVYEGEGHGWRRLATVTDELDRIDRFLRRYVRKVATG